LAAIAPKHVAKLVLLGTGGMGLPAPGAAPKLRRIELAMGSAEVESTHRHNLAALMIADPGKVDDVAVAIQIENVRHARLRAGGIPASDVLLRVLPRVRARLYGIWGELDAFARPNIAARAEVLRRFQPGLDFRIIGFLYEKVRKATWPHPETR
jgi:pimeloyl-ACP methyl ester carboxylesterase